MKTHFYLLVIFAGLLFARENNIIERTSIVSDNSSDSQTAFRTGDYGLVCQNESGSYNTDMENYIYSPTIDIPTGDQVSVDFLLRGSFLDGDDFPNVDFWSSKIAANNF